MMSTKSKSFLQRWLINTLGVLVAANVIHGIRYDTVLGLIVASLLLGILNAFVRPIMILLSLPLLILSLGLFILVINAVLLYLVGSVLQTFHVDSFGAAFFGAIVVSVISLIGNWTLGSSEPRVRVTHQRSGSTPSHPRSNSRNDDGGGPIIDV